MTIQEVLADNPFTDSVVSKWGKDLNDFNSGKKRLEDLRFILDGDLNYLARGDKEKLHTELVPKPFMGNPLAPVWYLPINPSYSDADRYDDLGVCPDCGAKSFQSCSCDIMKWLDKGKDKARCLVSRQKVLLTQLRLNCKSSFAFLEDVFNTLGECKQRRDNGGYRWWKRRLFGVESSTADFLLRVAGVEMNATSVGEKLFVLESFPYHSKNFDVRYYTATDYFKFWKKLVGWGIDNDKKFIVRARNKKFVQLISAANLRFNDDNMVSLKERGAFVSRRNLTCKETTLCSILDALRA